MSLLTRPPHGNDFIPCWSLELLFTVMLDVSTALKKNNEIKKHPQVCPVFRVVSILTAWGEPMQTVLVPLWELKGGGGLWSSWTPSIAGSTMGLHYQDYGDFLKAARHKMLLQKALPNFMSFFRWMMVIESDMEWEWYGQGQIKSSRAQQNTSEACYNGAVMMEDICF